MGACLVLTSSTLASNDKDSRVNYCLDEQKNADWEQQLHAYSKDHAVLKLYALRRGLCLMIEEKKITLKQAIDIFELEKAITIQKRYLDDLHDAPPEHKI